MQAFYNWGILGAVRAEIQPLITGLKSQNISRWKNRSIYQGDLHSGKLVITASGIGQKKAAEAAQHLIDAFAPKAILFVGTAGALNPDLKILDIVVGERVIQPDRAKDTWFYSDPELMQLALRAAEEIDLGERVKTGSVLTVAQPVSDSRKKKMLRHTFSGDCVEMEGAAVAQVCRNFRLPFLLVRAITDFADEHITKDFQQYEFSACQDAARLILKMLSLGELHR